MAKRVFLLVGAGAKDTARCKAFSAIISFETEGLENGVGTFQKIQGYTHRKYPIKNAKIEALQNRGKERWTTFQLGEVEPGEQDQVFLARPEDLTHGGLLKDDSDVLTLIGGITELDPETYLPKLESATATTRQN